MYTVLKYVRIYICTVMQERPVIQKEKVSEEEEEVEVEDEKIDLWQMWNHIREDGKKVVSNIYVYIYVCIYLFIYVYMMFACRICEIRITRARRNLLRLLTMKPTTTTRTPPDCLLVSIIYIHTFKHHTYIDAYTYIQNIILPFTLDFFFREFNMYGKYLACVYVCIV